MPAFCKRLFGIYGKKYGLVITRSANGASCIAVRANRFQLLIVLGFSTSSARGARSKMLLLIPRSTRMSFFVQLSGNARLR